MKNNRFALISVYNKEKIEQLCEIFKKNNIYIISTGSTATYITKKGYNCYLVSEFTKFNEILSGKVKTLHPKIYASLLFDRKNKKQVNEFHKLNFPIIDFIVVNLYPFEDIIKTKSSYKECINNIDISSSFKWNYRNTSFLEFP